MITVQTQKKLAKMTPTEQTEWISVFCGKHNLKYGIFVEKFGHLIPPPMSTTDEDAPKQRKERIKTCARCGKLFGQWRGHSDYCPDCRLEVRRERENAWKAKKRAERQTTRKAFKVREPKIYHKECAVCGKAIETSSAQTKFCPDCAKARTRERVRANNRRIYALQKRSKMKR